MPTTHEALSRELTALMEAHNRWTARVAGLQRLASSLAEPDRGMAAELERAQAELAAAEARAAEWEQKARHLSQLLYRERSERSRRIRELEQELDRIKRGL